MHDVLAFSFSFKLNLALLCFFMNCRFAVSGTTETILTEIALKLWYGSFNNGSPSHSRTQESFQFLLFSEPFLSSVLYFPSHISCVPLDKFISRCLIFYNYHESQQLRSFERVSIFSSINSKKVFFTPKHIFVKNQIAVAFHLFCVLCSILYLYVCSCLAGFISVTLVELETSYCVTFSTAPFILGLLCLFGVFILPYKLHNCLLWFCEECQRFC